MTGSVLPAALEKRLWLCLTVIANGLCILRFMVLEYVPFLLSVVTLFWSLSLCLHHWISPLTRTIPMNLICIKCSNCLHIKKKSVSDWEETHVTPCKSINTISLWRAQGNFKPIKKQKTKKEKTNLTSGNEFYPSKICDIIYVLRICKQRPTTL